MFSPHTFSQGELRPFMFAPRNLGAGPKLIPLSGLMVGGPQRGGRSSLTRTRWNRRIRASQLLSLLSIRKHSPGFTAGVLCRPLEFLLKAVRVQSHGVGKHGANKAKIIVNRFPGAHKNDRVLKIVSQYA